MSDFTTSNIGQINGAGDRRALFLKKFSGEIITRLPDFRETMGLDMQKTLKGAKEYQFPYTGTLTPKYHTPGQELTGQNPNQNEKVIALDDLMVVDRFMPKVDRLMTHYDERKPYVDQMTETLAVTMDKNMFHEAVLGARESAVVDGNDAEGLVISNDKFKLDIGGDAAAAQSTVELAQAYKAALKVAAAEFKKKRVPASVEKILFVSWDVYFNILDAVDSNGFSLFNKDYASGSLEEGMLPPVYGIKIKGANHLPTANITGVASPQDATNGIHYFHQGDFSKTVGVIICTGAIGTVKAADISLEMDPYQARYKGQLVTADYLCGHGWLRPEMLVELELDTLAN